MATSSSEPAPQVVVGLDLRGRCYGALHFLKCLQALSQQSLKLTGVHAFSGVRANLLSSVLGSDNAIERVRSRLEAVCEAQVPGLLNEITITQDQERPEALQFFAESRRAEMLVLGRVAPRDPTPFVRLGSVARAVLQGLMQPTLVIPSDFEVEHFRSGPVMVAIDANPTSQAALHFGQRWAALCGRKLVLAHVLPSTSFLGEAWLSQEHAQKARDQLHRDSLHKLQQWREAHGADKYELVLGTGEVFQEIRYLATHHEACMLVTGSRCLDSSERIFSTSISNALAASCDLPVAVVPSPLWDDSPEV